MKKGVNLIFLGIYNFIFCYEYKIGWLFNIKWYSFNI